MSSVTDLWASTLNLTREVFQAMVTNHVENAVDNASYFYLDPDEQEVVVARSSVRSFATFIPNASQDDEVIETFYVELTDLENEDGAPLPSAFFRIRVEPIDRPVERND